MSETVESDPTPPLPPTYPDRNLIGEFRTEDIDFGGLPIRMTITPGESIVQLWELVDGHPVRWVGNVFRVGHHTPLLYLNFKCSHLFPGRQMRDDLALDAAEFWKR